MEFAEVAAVKVYLSRRKLLHLSINESKKRLEEVITKKVEHFAYPFGAVTDREFRLAKKAEFKTLATVLRGPICYRKTRSDALPRIGVVHNDFSFFANL